MNGYQVNVSSSRSLAIPHKRDLPVNLYESEIMVIDTALRHIIIGDEYTSLNVIYNHTPSFVDLLPLDMSAVMKKIFSSEKRQLIFVFCESYNNERYTLLADSNSYDYIQSSTYCFPDPINLKQVSGERMNMIGGTSTDAQCAQISKIALRRKKANPGNTYKAVYIVNHRRYKAPKERELVPFNENQITDAEIANRGMTFTYELFNIYHMIEAGVISKEAAREAFKQEGLMNFRHSLHRLEFNHCYDRVVVYSLIIPADSNFTVSKVDKIAIQDIENHWHLLNIESIEIDRVPYDEVNNGTVGIKVDRIVPGARDYYVVKVSQDKELQDA